MMGWNLVILSFAFKQMELNGGVLSSSMFVTLFLQTVYIFKFFIWESGYFRSIDIMHDRFGFYICWGCMCWITGFYTFTSLWFVNHPIENPWPVSLAIIVFGLVNIWINYDADRQRQVFRETNGNSLIWGKKPSHIVAHYVTEEGKDRTNLLLTSGWWGYSRHFHYIPEILLSLCWALPAGLASIFPYIYTIYLVVLLLERSFRDEERCRKKYGEDWKKYCRIVPYKIIPYIY
jgi:7-dehydrocholesterol reductase